MKGKLFATCLALGISGQAAAQDPAVNLQNALGDLVPNLTATADSMLALEVTSTMVSLNRSVAAVQSLSAGTPLEVNNNIGNTLVALGTPHTRRIDRILRGQESPTALLDQTNLQSLSVLGTFFTVSVINGLIINPEGTALDPATFLAMFDDSLSPFEELQLSALLAGALGDNIGLFDTAVLTGLLSGTGVFPLDPSIVVGVLNSTGDLPLDPSTLTGLLGGGAAGGLPLGALPLATVLDLAAAGAAGGGLSADQLPLSAEALDPATLTALLGGAQLPGL